MYKVLKSSKAAIRFSLKHSKKYLSENRYQESSACIIGSHLEEQTNGLVTPQGILFLIQIITNKELKLINQWWSILILLIII